MGRKERRKKEGEGGGGQRFKTIVDLKLRE
jgi:hypothetical protein